MVGVITRRDLADESLEERTAEVYAQRTKDMDHSAAAGDEDAAVGGIIPAAASPRATAASSPAAAEAGASRGLFGTQTDPMRPASPTVVKKSYGGI